MGFIYPRAVPKIGLRSMHDKFHFGNDVHIARSHGLELTGDEAVTPRCHLAVNWKDPRAITTTDKFHKMQRNERSPIASNSDSH